MNCTICAAIIPEGSTICPDCQTCKQGNSTPPRRPWWKEQNVFLALICILGLWMVSGVVGKLFTSGTVEIELVDVSPTKEVNEERFLLFLVEHQLDTILYFSRLKPEEAAPVIAETKTEAQSLVAHLQQHPVETQGSLQAFQKVVELADAYDGMIREVSGIETAAKERRGTEAIKAGLKSGVAGWGTMQALDSGDGAGAVVGLLGALVTTWQHGQALEADRKGQIERVASGFLTDVDQARADAVVVADAVAQKHSWNRGTVGLTRDRKSYGQERLVRTTKELAPVLAELARQTPLNPILPFNSIMLEDFLDGDGTSQQQHLEWAAKFVELTRLVPSGAVYDFLRWRYMMRAGLMALKAAEQKGKGKKLGESTKAAVTSASYWKTALSINESDPSGELRWGYGRSLALAGNLNEAREVLSAIKDHFASSPDYHYLLARLTSVEDDPQQALDYLKQAVSNGFSRIAEVRETPDLENLRSAHATEVSELLAVKFGWTVNYGIFNDDITITNLSAFPLTQLVLSPVISNLQGSFRPKKTLTLEKLDPGKSHTWVSCISVSGGGDADGRKAVLQCDQSTR